MYKFIGQVEYPIMNFSIEKEKR